MAGLFIHPLSVTNLGPDPQKPKQNLFNVRVKVDVTFSELEQCVMKLCNTQPWYNLEATVYSEDHPRDHNQDHPLGQGPLGEATSPFVLHYQLGLNSSTTHEFVFQIEGQYMNEDPGPAPPEAGGPWQVPPGTDEVYVKIRLFNILSNTVVSDGESNVIRGVFF